MGIKSCALVMVLAALVSCDRRPADRRPANLVGTVACEIVDTLSSTSLMVRLTLDSGAATQPARMEILPLKGDTSEPGVLPNRLVAGFGAANGSIQQCGCALILINQLAG